MLPTTQHNYPKIKQVVPWTEPLFHRVIDQYTYHSDPPLNQVLRQESKLIHVVSHSGSLSWLPSGLVLGREMLHNGGQQRRIETIFSRNYYKTRFTRFLIRNFFRQAKPPKYAQLLHAFRKGELNDLLLYPEGDLCIVGDPRNIRDFVSYRYLELSIETQTPLLITVHVGSEAWFDVESVGPLQMAMLRAFSPRYYRVLTKQPTPSFNFPKRLNRLPWLFMRSRLTPPLMEASELEEDPDLRHEQLAAASTYIQQVMTELLEEIRQS